jgi:short-subunit dehydrogenase involved in D-alanine esterification of teichoic acids
MPLKDYISETMGLLQTVPTPAEICVKNVYFLRFAAEEGRYIQTYETLNEMRAKERT